MVDPPSPHSPHHEALNALHLEVNSEGKLARWSKRLSLLSLHTAETVVGRPITELLVALEPADLFAQIPSEGATGLVTLSRPRGVAPSLVARMNSTAQGYEIILNSAAQNQIHDVDQTAAERLRAMLNWVPGFCYTVDTNLVFTSSRGAGLANIQLADDQLVGMSLTDLWGTQDTGYEPLQCHLRAFGGLTQRYRDVCVGRSLDYEVSPLRNHEGVIIGAVGVGLDVTDRESGRDEKARLLAQLRQAQKMESVGQLAGGIAHDFNNLLTCIMGNVALALDLTEPKTRTAEMLRGAASAAESAATLTRQLLAFSRKQVIEPRPLKLDELVERVQTMLRRLIGQEITLTCSSVEDLWFVRADPGQLEQILVNLVVNARDAISGRGTIVISTENHELGEDSARVGQLAAGQYVHMTVKDDGQGMSEQVRLKLFEPFFTTKELGEGTGLGLATVYGSIQQNGGEITVQSALGEGSEFHIYLPRIAAPVGIRKEESTARPSDRVTKGGSEHILLVEDEVSVLELSQRTLESLGYHVYPCTSADEALRLLESDDDQIDMVVTDVVMPRLNGKELAGRITSLHPGMPILFTSGYGESIIAINGVIDSDLHFLAKPYRPAQLARKVREVLDEERQKKEDHELSTTTAS